MKRTDILFLTMPLVVAVAISCASTTQTGPGEHVKELPTLTERTGSEYILGKEGKLVVFLWNGYDLVKTVTITPDLNVTEELTGKGVDMELYNPRMTARVVKGKDIFKVPLSARPPLSYEGEYIIGPEDVVDIHVWNNEPLSKRVPVRPDGKISLPLVEDVNAAGLTALELREKLTEMFKEFVGSPEVTVTLVEMNSYKIYIQGKVAEPGVYKIGSRTNLVQAISMAGGFAEWAATDGIVLIRNEHGTTKRMVLNYKKIISGQKPEDNVVLLPGDTIYVP